MNIIHVSSGEVKIPVEKGGAVEDFIFILSRCLVQMGHNVTIMDRKYRGNEPPFEIVDGVRIVRLKARKFNLSILKKPSRFRGLLSKIEELVNYLSFSSSVNKYLSTLKDTDVIHTHFSVIALVLAVLNKRLLPKSVYTCHTAIRLFDKPSLIERLSLVLENMAVRRISKVIVDNVLTKDKLVKVAHINPGKVRILPYGVDVKIFHPAIDTGDIRGKYDLGKKPIILFVGRITEHKGVEYLVKAANIVVHGSAYKDAQFLLVGPGGFRDGMENSPYQAKISGLIGEYGLQQNLKLLGRIPLDDLIKLYGVSDIFVLPSITEMAPTVVREAMACARPVIATRVGNVTDLLEDGVSGLLIESRNEKQLAEKIIYMADKPAEAQKMGINGRKIIEDRSWEKTAEKLATIYAGN